MLYSASLLPTYSHPPSHLRSNPLETPRKVWQKRTFTVVRPSVRPSIRSSLVRSSRCGMMSGREVRVPVRVNRMHSISRHPLHFVIFIRVLRLQPRQAPADWITLPCHDEGGKRGVFFQCVWPPILSSSSSSFRWDESILALLAFVYVWSPGPSRVSVGFVGLSPRR